MEHYGKYLKDRFEVKATNELKKILTRIHQKIGISICSCTDKHLSLAICQ